MHLSVWRSLGRISVLLASIALAGAAQALPAAVGRTAGSFAVSSTGSANYSIPLWTPPGIAGLQPSLALVYSSSSGDGAYGVGWNLAGQSAITRCNQTVAQDGIAASVTLASTDQYCLDGKRLRSFSGTYGADGTEYQTEVADFSLVISHGTAGTGPAWFEVHGKNGLVYEYGHTTDSTLVATGVTTVLTWALNRVTDPFGNAIIYTYTQPSTNGVSDQVQLLNTIAYAAASSSATPQYQVSLSYVANTSTKIPSGFVAGAAFLEPNLVQTITVSSLSGSSYVTARTYNLAYTLGTGTGRSTLNSVQECSATECFPATTITYQNGTPGWTTGVASSGNVNLLSEAFVLDLNGDGFDDLVYPDAASGHWVYRLGAATGTYAGPYDSGVTYGNTSLAAVMDYAGHGNQGLIVAGSTGYFHALQFASVGAAFTNTTTNLAVPAGLVGVYAGDVDGDGRDDLIYFVSGGSTWQDPDTIYSSRNTGTAFATPVVLKQWANGASCVRCTKFVTPPMGDYPAYNSASRIRRADFNGDGRIDFLVHTNTCLIAGDGVSCTTNTLNWVLMVSGADGTTYSSLGVLSNNITSYTGNLRPPLIGDFNGDGCSDLLYNNGTNLMVQYGTCFRTGQTSILSSPVTTTIGMPGIYPIVIDWDGDGMDDLVDASAISGGVFEYAKSTGTGFSNWASTGLSYNNSDSGYFAVVADVNGDGLYDIVYPTGAGHAPTVLRHGGVGVRPDLATSFVDGFGVTYSPTYTQLTNPTYYVKGTGSVYPERDWQGSMNVVASYSATDGVGSTYTVSQYYQQARFDVSGRGFEGFYLKRSQDSRTSFYATQYFEQPFPWTGGAYETVLLQSDNATPIRSTTNTWAKAVLATGTTTSRVFPYVSQSVELTYEYLGSLNGSLIGQKTTAFTYSGPNGFTYGNPSQVVTTTVDEDATSPNHGSSYTATLAITPYEQGWSGTAGWCIHLPSQVAETRTTPAGSLQHTTAYSVNASGQCEVDSQTVEPSSTTGDKVVTTYGHDSFGNINSISVTGQTPTGAAMTARTTGITAETTGLAPHTTRRATDLRSSECGMLSKYAAKSASMICV